MLLGLAFFSQSCGGPAEKKQAEVAVPEKEGLQFEETAYGILPDSTPVQLFTLRNEQGVEATITNYGATLLTLLVPDKEGRLEDMVLGHDSLAAYLNDRSFFGSTVGRYANRIAEGKFSLDGQEYELAVNSGMHHLHGGNKAFDNSIWEAEEYRTAEEVGVKLHYLSKDMEEGYPGNLSVEVIYSLNNENELKIEYKATTDKKTIVNLTNHSYFNLSGDAKRDVLDHQLMINAKHFIPVGETLIPDGELREVAGTPFDFREPTAIGKNIEADNQQLRYGSGFDHSWVLGKKGEMSLGATVYEPGSGRFMEMFTTEPGVQLYTANHLNGKVGKKGAIYQNRYALCLETQHFPDSPNQPEFPSVVLNPGETYHSATSYKFSLK